MGLARRIGGKALPLGSPRRARVAALARATGLWSGPADTDYQRWVRSVEPQLLDDRRPRTDPEFTIDVRVDARAEVADLERTLLSLQAQRNQQWTAVLHTATDVPARLAGAVDRARMREPRLVDAHPSDGVHITVDAGDALAPITFDAVAVELEEHPRCLAVVADADRLSASGDQRVDRIHIPPLDPDAVQQFDLLAGFCASRGPVDPLTSLDGITSLPVVLLHRRHRLGPRVVQPHPTDPARVQQVLGERGTAGPGPVAFGTRVRHQPPESPGRTAVVVRDPIDPPWAAHQAEQLVRRLGPVAVTVPHPAGATTPGAQLAAWAQELDADTVLVLDGGTSLVRSDSLGDLLGALWRDDVLGVAPIVTVPSGLVADAGLIRRDGALQARCGGLTRPPFDLSVARGVDAFSGRAFAMRTADLPALADLRPTSFEQLRAATGRRLVVWPHQRVRLDVGLERRDAGTPGAAAWTSGRLADWFGPGIPGYRPLNDAKTEAVW